MREGSGLFLRVHYTYRARVYTQCITNDNEYKTLIKGSVYEENTGSGICKKKKIYI